MIHQVLLQTIVTRDLEGALTAWTGEMGWEVTARGSLDGELASFWRTEPEPGRRFVLVASPGAGRGFLRLVEGPEDDEAAGFDRPGLFNAELLCADVDELYERVDRSSRFRPLCAPTTYDLGSTGGAVSRSFATRGPGGAGVFFTTYLSVPPPRQLPRCDHLVGPMFNSALAVDDEAGMRTVYEKVLGLGRFLQGRIASPAINRILGLPPDRAFFMVVYKGNGDGLIEVDLHEAELPEVSHGGAQLAPGNCFLTLESTDLDGVMERAGEAGAVESPARVLEAPPYRGRRAGLLRGPAHELIEVIESGRRGTQPPDER